MYLQVILISYDDLPPEQKEWLQSRSEEEYKNVVCVKDGDASEQYELDLDDILTPLQLIKAIQEEGGFSVTISEDLPDVYQQVLSLVQEGIDEVKKGYWARTTDIYFEQR